MSESNKEYLSKMKEAHDKWMDEYNLKHENFSTDKEYDLTRIARALEIIAENSITINQNLIVIGNELTAIKNLQ